MKSTHLIKKPIQDLGRFVLVEVYNPSGQFLYKTSEEKPLPTKEYNEAIIKAQQPKVIPFTTEEKREMSGDKATKRMFTDAQVREIRELASKGVTHRNIAAMFDAGCATITSVLAGRTYKHVN